MSKTRDLNVEYIYKGKKYKYLKEICKISGKRFEVVKGWFRRGSDGEGNICIKITLPK